MSGVDKVVERSVVVLLRVLRLSITKGGSPV